MHPADMVVNEMSLADELAISTVDHDELVTLLAASFPLGEWLDTVVYRAQTGEIAVTLRYGKKRLVEYAGIEYAALPVSVKCSALQSNTAPDNAADSLSTCQSFNHLTPHRFARRAVGPLGLPGRGGRYRPPRSPDAVVGLRSPAQVPHLSARSTRYRTLPRASTTADS
jgi:hypothetical protein